MNIVYIITGLTIGGAETQVCNLASEFSKKGDNVLIISLGGPQIVLPKSEGVMVISLHMTKTLFGFSRGYFNARKIIKKFNPDVIHSHMFHANIFARLLRIILKMPKLICSAHSSNEGGRLRTIIYRITDSLCDITTNVSEFAKQEFINKGATPYDRIITVPNGVDTEVFKFSHEAREKLRSELLLTSNEVLLLSVGRLTSAKDYPTLLQAFQILLCTHSNTRLAIAGDGELKSELIKQCSTLKVIEKVVFLGSRNDIPHLMCASDVFVISSEWEGFGLVIAEAMASERHVVATDCGGPADIIIEKDFLVKIKDPIALSNAIKRSIMLSEEEYKNLSTRSRMQVIKNFSLSSAVCKWRKLYV